LIVTFGVGVRGPRWHALVSAMSNHPMNANFIRFI
jgi:hypothetical protein